MSERSPYRPWSRWNRHRQRCFEVKGRVCQVRLLCDGAPATEVDHIVPWRDGGAWFDLDNLRPSCKPCNISRASNQKHLSGWERSPVRIVLIDDAAGIEASTGDVVIDPAALRSALAGGGQVTHEHRGVAAAVLQRLVHELRRGELLEAGRVWIVDASPEAPQLYPFHTHRRKAADGAETQTVQAAGEGVARFAVEPGRW